MWTPSFSPDYFSLSDILATEERVPLVTKSELPQLGFLDPVRFHYLWGGRHSSGVLSAPTILRPRVQITSEPSMLSSINIVEIVIVIAIRKGQKRGRVHYVE